MKTLISLDAQSDQDFFVQKYLIFGPSIERIAKSDQTDRLHVKDYFSPRSFNKMIAQHARQEFQQTTF